MKITARPLKGDGIEIEAQPEDTVAELKKKIAAVKSEFPVEQQKLIFCGKILTDDMIVKDQNIKEGDFLVVMATKPKPAAPAGGEATSGSGTAAAPPAVAAAPAPVPMETDAPPSMEAAQATVVSGSAMEGTIQQLMDMGFPRPEVERCLQAAFNNPDRAVEYLMTGIPENLMSDAPGGGAPPAATPAGGNANPAPAATPTPAAPPAATGGGGATPFPALGGAAGGGGGGGGAPNEDTMGAFAELRNNPNFAQLAGMIAQNPAMLQQILPVVAQQSPQLAQAIQQNPQEFMRMIQSTAAEGQVDQTDPVAVMLAAAQAGGPMPGQHVVRLTEDEAAAVQRLQGLGFSREACVQAYLACDKNEEIAANFLFENMDES
mmetsp:Transcript_63753/g.151985  ORF Transcript_63753/g.151985 Transcript_63753/m.151985 type:complete len:376 (+) Transcript_63753:119-1246(+)|eukprot:CAMPEP_0178415352 /NCGR_PEP_ID=MMETSP0689_2-20121128/23507_1 /TAXON_ID=160604 /ORGANISM="Amphidinium massartii, Strain CS-259" /LENGTH=375 /DNA_ID=CAMNT_0020036669 /DNA_START=119 /DNA_END=1246 /DNA_ORIENTATION=-